MMALILITFYYVMTSLSMNCFLSIKYVIIFKIKILLHFPAFFFIRTQCMLTSLWFSIALDAHCFESPLFFFFFFPILFLFFGSTLILSLFTPACRGSKKHQALIRHRYTGWCEPYLWQWPHSKITPLNFFLPSVHLKPCSIETSI